MFGFDDFEKKLGPFFINKVCKQFGDVREILSSVLGLNGMFACV